MISGIKNKTTHQCFKSTSL